MNTTRNTASSSHAFRAFSLAVFVLLALAGVMHADATVSGDHFTTTANGFYVYAYSTGSQGCAYTLSPSFIAYAQFNASSTHTSGHNGYSMTIPSAYTNTTVYFALCENIGGNQTPRASYNTTITDGNAYYFDASRVSTDATLHTDLAGTQKWLVCAATTGGTKLNDQSTAFNINSSAYFFKDFQWGAGFSYYVFAKDTDGSCAIDTTVMTGRYVNGSSSSADDWIGVDVLFSPDTKVTGTINTAFKQLWVQNATANLGFTDKIAAGTATLYYDNPVAGDPLTIYAFTGSNFPTLSGADEVITGYTNSTFTGAVTDLTYKLSGSVPDSVASVQTTIGAITYTVPTIAGSPKTYALYIPASIPTLLFQNSSGSTLFSYTSAVVGASKTVTLSEIQGGVHSDLNAPSSSIQFFEGNACTGTTTIKSTAVTPSSSTYASYLITTDDVTTISTVYPKIIDAGTYTTCGAGVTISGVSTTVDYTALITGTKSAGLNSGGVALDINNNDVYTAGLDPYTVTAGTTTYKLYTTVAGSHKVMFFSSTAGSQPATLELKMTHTISAGNTTVNVAQVGWTAANIHADINNTVGTSACGAAYEACQLVVTEAASPATTLSSETRPYNVTSIQYYEVPTTLGVNLNVKNSTGTTTLFYVNNYTSSAGNLTTFEPKYRVTLTAPAGIVAMEITGGALFSSYRDATSTYAIYADNTDAPTTATFKAYTDTGFTTLALSRGSKNAQTAGVWQISSLTLASPVLPSMTDPFTVYNQVASFTADCNGAALSSATNNTLSTGVSFVKYFEYANIHNLQFSYVNTSAGIGATCINTLVAGPAAGVGNSYALNVLTQGTTPSDIASVYIDADQANGNDINQSTVAGATNNTYMIYWAGHGASSDLYYYSGGSSVLERTHNLVTSSTVNVGKVSGSSNSDLTTAVVYSAACSTATSSVVVDPGSTYAQYFEVSASNYLGAGDGTHSQCKLDALTIGSNMQAYENMDRLVSGTVPDLDGALTTFVRSTGIISPGTTLGYATNVVNAATTTYKLYINSTGAAVSNSTINFFDTMALGGTNLLFKSKDFSSDAIVNVSAVYGAGDAAINTVEVCYGTMPTYNTACSTKASTRTFGVSPYQAFFEQLSAVTTYYTLAKDTDAAVDYYSWRNFTSSAGGAITNIVLDGQLKGTVTELYDGTTPIANVSVVLSTSGADVPTFAKTYTYTDGTYRTYSDTASNPYRAKYAKGGYITANTNTLTLSTTNNVNLSTNIVVHVTDNGGNPINDSLVQIYTCGTSTSPAACTALAPTCVNPAGNCNRSASNNATGYYFFADDVADGQYIQVRATRAPFDTVFDPAVNASVNLHIISSSTAITPTEVLSVSVPTCTLTAVGGTNTYSASGVLYAKNVTGVVSFVADCGAQTSYTVVGNLAAIGGSASAAFTNLGNGLYNYTQLVGAVADGTKTITVNVSNSQLSSLYYSTVVTDGTPPVVSALTPLTASVQNTKSVTLSATTDTTATCRYSTSNVAYSSMAGVLAGTETLHQAMVLAANGANTYYVTCIDLVGNEMAARNSTTFSVDAVAPTVLSVTPAYSATPYNVTTLAAAGGIQVKTDVAANCMWDTSDVNYTAMAHGPLAVLANTYATLTGATAANGLNNFYVRCQTSGGSVMSSSGLISFNYDSVAPTYEVTSVSSNGGMSSGGKVYAKIGDIITVKFSANENITGTPTVTIGGESMTYSNYSGGVFTYKVTLSGGATGAAAIAIIGGSDAAGNAATAYNDSGANAYFDITAPIPVGGSPTTTQNSRSFLVSVNGGETGLTCKYSFSNVLFAAMEGTMADLGTNTYQATATVASDGSKTVYFACRDLAGNVGTANTGAFSVLTTAPVVTSITPQGGYQTSAVTVTVTTAANANCSWSTVDGTSYAAMTNFTSTDSTTHTTAVTSVQGLNHVYVLCSANGVSMTSSVLSYYTYDTVAPDVFDYGYTMNRTARTIKVWILSSEALNQSTLAMTFDGSAMSYFFGNGSVYTFNYTYGASLSGVHNITVGTCTDLAGNACALEPVYFPIQVTIDEAAPTTTSAYSASTWMLTVTTNEAATCMYDYSNVSYGSMAYAMFGSDTAHNVMVHPYESSSAYYVYVRCEDLYGNAMAYSDPVNISSDTTAPSIINSAPSGIYTSLTAPTLEVNTSEAATCQYKTSAFAWGSGTNMTDVSATRHNITLGALSDGTYSYYVLCRDTAGNTMASGFPITFVVNTVGNFNYTYSLNLGWNSFWLPRIVMQNLSSFSDGNYTTVNVLNTKGNLTGSYTYVYYRNGTSCSSQNGSCWQSYDPASAVNDLTVFNDWDNLPYWINMNASGKRLAYT